MQKKVIVTFPVYGVRRDVLGSVLKQLKPIRTFYNVEISFWDLDKMQHLFTNGEFQVSGVSNKNVEDAIQDIQVYFDKFNRQFRSLPMLDKRRRYDHSQQRDSRRYDEREKDRHQKRERYVRELTPATATTTTAAAAATPAARAEQFLNSLLHSVQQDPERAQLTMDDINKWNPVDNVDHPTLRWRKRSN